MSSRISLSRRQAKEADRVGGIELMVLYPAELGAPPRLADDEECEASMAERRHAEGVVGQSCRAAGLVPVHVRVARVRRPPPPPLIARAGEYAEHLAVTIIGQRWVHASTQRVPRVMFAADAS